MGVSVLEIEPFKYYKKIKIRKPFKSIQTVISVSFTAITVLAMLIVGIVLYNMFSRTLERYASDSTEQIMEQVTINMESYLKGMMEISDVIANNLYTNYYAKPENMKIMLDATTKIRKDIVSLAVFNSKGEAVFSTPQEGFNKNYSAKEYEWFKEATTNTQFYVFVPPHVQTMYDEKRPWVVSLSRGLVFDNGVGKENWVSKVDMNFSVIEEMCKKVSLGKRGYLYVIDRQGNIIYHPQQQIIYAGLKNENISNAMNLSEGSYIETYEKDKRLLSIKEIKYSGWKIVGISYVDDIIAGQKKIQIFVIFVFAFAVLFMGLASIVLSKRISKPIKKLEKEMKKVEQGEFDICIDVKGEDEVNHLSKTFNIMVSKIRSLMEQIIEEQEAIRKSELKALQAQINPHFLYNTLDSIVWMNENHKYESVTIMVAALARLFRISINKGKDIISVQDELEHAKAYLTIQKIRYKERFEYEFEIEDAVLMYKTLKLILQPIIENAIYHGIEPLHETGFIKIKASLLNDGILMQVIDNGYGIKPDVLKNILQIESKKENALGVGVKNVHERIQLYFGKEYGLKIESELDVGTTVSIWIPREGIGDGK